MFSIALFLKFISLTRVTYLFRSRTNGSSLTHFNVRTMALDRDILRQYNIEIFRALKQKIAKPKDKKKN